MKAKVYAEVTFSESSEYINIESYFLECQLENKYNDISSRYEKFELIEGFKLSYVFLEVEFDGRKKVIEEDDILQSFHSLGLADKIGENMFGGYYIPTKKLTTLLKNQLEERKLMMRQGLLKINKNPLPMFCIRV